MTIQVDIENPKNLHIQEGKPYSVDELFTRAWKEFHRFETSKGVNTESLLRAGARFKGDFKDVKNAFRGSIEKLVNTINPLLKAADTPLKRRKLMREFNDLLEQKYKKMHENK